MYPSLYAKYLKERTPGILILETSKGFATYTFTDSDTVYIQDIYVKPEYRNKGYASKLANTIAFRAKRLGCSTMIGTVLNGAKGAKASQAVLKGYGMQLQVANSQFSIYSKELR